MPTKKPVFLVIDGNSLLHRAWHAIPVLQTKDGTPVNALYGFLSILFKAWKDLNPSCIAVAFDRKEPTFRDKMYKEYKAGREKQPDELYAQIPMIVQALEFFNIPCMDKAGFEADDILATVAEKLKKEKLETVILTGDQDTMQLVGGNVKVCTFKKGISDTMVYDTAAVEARYGLKPEQMVDYKSLRGDPSDNIPGVKGIGEKTAVALLTEFGTLEKVYVVAEKGKTTKSLTEAVIKKLLENKDNAMLAKRLVVLDRDVKIDFSLAKCAPKITDPEKLKNYLMDMGFKSLVARIPFKVEEAGDAQGDLFNAPTTSVPTDSSITTEKDLKTLLEKLKDKQFSFWFDPIGFLGLADSRTSGQVSRSLYGSKTLKDFFNSHSKNTYNFKAQMHAEPDFGLIVAKDDFDCMIAAYLVGTGIGASNLETLLFEEAGILFESLTDNNRADRVAQTLVSLTPKLVERLQDEKMESLYRDVEHPLITVLQKMEAVGIEIDTAFLAKFRKQTDAARAKLEADIWKMAGEEFNINSPLQLKQILFDKLHLAPKKGKLKSGKTGVSTAAGELAKLQGSHPIIDKVLDYRELQKLISTYIDSLPKLVDKNGRIHTTFNQNVAATGRLSSSDPNLQNIPIRTDLGKKIRNAFIADKGQKILSLDYSQIELRIAAVISGDKEMLAAFKKGEDIHRHTAAEIFKKKHSDVTDRERSAAKTINFGILYGMGPMALSQSLGISMAEARQFIDRYFEVHKGIANYIEETKALAAARGYVETMFGRRRYIPDITSNIPMIQAGAERMAVNMPIQGANADIIKMAMIEIDKKLSTVSNEARMLLQVHDELVFEVPEREVKKVAEFVSEIMENVYKGPIVMKVEAEVGDNWGQMDKLKI